MPSTIWKPISIVEGNLLRSFAILTILTHNFLHWIHNNPGENEFNDHSSRGQIFLTELSNNPSDFIRLLSTFFGHYGVQIFIFLSGYGLTIKYKNSPPSYLPFLKKRLTSLYPSIIIAALSYLLYESIRLGFTTVISTQGINLIRQVTGISNFIPENIYHPIGPWWFISLILQFYLIAPPIIHYTRRLPVSIPLILITLSLILEYTLSSTLTKYFNLNINHTIIGHLDTISLGILIAYKPPKKIPTLTTIIAITLTILGNFNAALWPLTSLTSVIASIPILRMIIQKIKANSLTHKFLNLTGNISLLLFLTNGYLRKPLITYAQQHTSPITHLFYLLVFLILTYTISLTLNQLLNQLQKPKTHPPNNH